jgi:hypothetical protein
MNSPPELIGPVNLGNPEEFTILELAEKVMVIAGSSSPVKRLPLPQDDPRQRRPDIQVARAKLHWEPRIPLDTGLRRTCDYFAQLLGEQRLVQPRRSAVSQADLRTGEQPTAEAEAARHAGVVPQF